MADERAKKIKLMLFDVDGVMTDGAIFLFPAPGGATGGDTHEHREKMAGKGASALPAVMSSRPRVSTRNVILDAKGNLYGTASQGGAYNWGVVWEITP